MRRVVPNQPDLFAPAPAPAPPPAPAAQAPLDELTELLALLRAAERMPWPTVPETIAVELHALNLGRLAGAEGERLAAAIIDETERLFAAAEQAALQR